MKLASYAVTAGLFAGAVREPTPGCTVIMCDLAPRSFQTPKAYVEPSLGDVVCGSAGTSIVCIELSVQLNVCGVV